MAGFIRVKVGKLPGVISEVALNGGRTVADALSAIELTAEGFDIRVNGSPATLGTDLVEGNIVLLLKPIVSN
jgi:sulfur carrier protein ThiS